MVRLDTDTNNRVRVMVRLDTDTNNRHLIGYHRLPVTLGCR